MKLIKSLMLGSILLSNSFAQDSLPPEKIVNSFSDFINPLEITNYLAGNFGELRSNHFHSGLDIKTQQKEGLKVFSIYDGYISRINVSPIGYGNAIYIDHPNGYTTVYAHLQKFEGELYDYVRKNQYEKETFALEIYPNPNELKISKGQLIGLSGNSGGSGGPHLHFEIRDTKTEEPINPLLFGIKIADNRKPNIIASYIYQLNPNNYQNIDRKLIVNNSVIEASGTIGFGIKAYDKQNGSENNNGIYKLEVIVNDKPIYAFTANRFAFNESRAINSVCDYSDLMKNNSWVYQAFVRPGNPLRMFTNLENNGILTIEAEKDYLVKLIVSDYENNSSEVNFTIKGKDNILDFPKIAFKNPMFWEKENVFIGNGIEVFFPKNIFYEDFDLTYKITGDKHQIGDWNFPVHHSFTLTMTPPDNIPVGQLDKAVIIREYQKKGVWKKSYIPTEYKNGKLIGQSKEFGIFSIELDNTKPKISALNIKQNSIFNTKNGIIKLNITDNQSGIKEYSAFIDGKWVLAAYDKKINRLTIDLNEEGIENGDHELEITVKDEKNNISTFRSSFKKTT